MLFDLTGCLPDQAKTMDDCRQEAERFYQLYKAVDPNDPSSKYIIQCMAAKGYRFTVEPKDCSERYPLVTQAACYEPDAWFDWAIGRLRRRLN
jgi:hypothetical protein